MTPCKIAYHTRQQPVLNRLNLHIPTGKITAVGVFLGGGAVPTLVGYVAEVASFSTAFTVVGALAIFSPLLLRVRSRRAAALSS